MSRVFQKEGSWWIDYKDVRGVRHRKKVGPDKRIAREVLDDILGKVARRVHLGVVEDSKISFSDFADIWKERVGPQLAKGTKVRWEGVADGLLKKAFPGSLRSITVDQVEAYQRQRLDSGVSKSTTNIEMTVLKHMINKALLWEHLSVNPIKGVKKFKEPPGRTRFLTPEEIEKLLAACTTSGFEKKEGHFFSDLLKGYLRPFVMIALNTGMRKGEILSLTRKDIDWKNRIATLNQTKNGEKRHAYLNEAALMALKAIPPRLDTDRLFPFGEDQIGMAFKRAVKRAGIEDFRLHDLRHTFCSYQAMSGVQGRGLMSLMGHRDGRMTTRYSHLSDAYLREAVNRTVLGLEANGAVDNSKNGTYLAPEAGQKEEIAPKR